MGTKQVKMEFQVAADDGISAQVTITASGTQVFSGAVAQTINPLPEQVLNNETPFSLVEFDLEVSNMPVPLTPANGPWPTPYVTPMDITIAVTGGNIALQETLANYTAVIIESTPPTTPPTYVLTPGDAVAFVTLRYATQPVWTPPATGRLDIADNVNTGPGTLVLLDNESVVYQVDMSLYSA